MSREWTQRKVVGSIRDRDERCCKLCWRREMRGWRSVDVLVHGSTCPSKSSFSPKPHSRFPGKQAADSADFTSSRRPTNAGHEITISYERVSLLGLHFAPIPIHHVPIYAIVPSRSRNLPKTCFTTANVATSSPSRTASPEHWWPDHITTPTILRLAL